LGIITIRDQVIEVPAFQFRYAAFEVIYFMIILVDIYHHSKVSKDKGAGVLG
jgi:hypothetical protein